MSTTPKKSTPQRIRYTDEQKKEIVDFVVSHNATNGRGGKSEASKKFKVSPISIAAWINGPGTAKAAKTPKTATAPKIAKTAKTATAPKAAKTPNIATAAKTATAPKTAKVPKSAIEAKTSTPEKTKTGTRYTVEEKKEVTDFVANYNAKNGRGGQTKAAAEFNISPITVMAWLRSVAVTKVSKKSSVAPAKVAKNLSTPASENFNEKLTTLLAMSEEIASAEAALAQLKGKFSSLKASL